MEEKPEGFLLGEVWEDGSNKIAYSRRRKYLLGRETHGLMNYPFRVSAMDYLRGGDAAALPGGHGDHPGELPPARLLQLYEHAGHPRQPADSHPPGHLPQGGASHPRRAGPLPDVPGGVPPGLPPPPDRGHSPLRLPRLPHHFLRRRGGEWRATRTPSTGGTFPWGREDRMLQRRFALLGSLRNNRRSLQEGELRWLHAQGHGLAFARELADEITIAATNAGDDPVFLTFDWPGRSGHRRPHRTAVSGRGRQDHHLPAPSGRCPPGVRA